MARDAISLLLDVPADSFEVEVRYPHRHGFGERAMIEAGAAGQRTRKGALPGGTERQLAACAGRPVDRHWRPDHGFVC